MYNLLRMDLCRMVRSASTWVVLALAAALGLFCVAMTAGDIQDMAQDPQYLAQMEEAASDGRTVGIYVETDLGWVDGPIEAGGVLSAELHSSLPALLAVIFTAHFAAAEQRGGYVKNLAGQIPHRSLLVLSKLVAAAAALALMLALFTLAVWLSGRAFWGDRFYLEAWAPVLRLLGAQYLLHLGLCALVLMLVVLLRQGALPMAAGILICCGVLAPLYALVDQWAGRFQPGFALSRYLLDGNLTSLTLSATGPELLRACLVGLCFTAAATAAAMAAMARRDVR